MSEKGSGGGQEPSKSVKGDQDVTARLWPYGALAFCLLNLLALGVVLYLLRHTGWTTEVENTLLWALGLETIAIILVMVWRLSYQSGYETGLAHAPTDGPSGEIAGAPGFDALSPQSPNAPRGRVLYGVMHRRRRLGYVLGAASLIVFVLVVVASLVTLHATEKPTTQVEEKFQIGMLVAHAIVTVTLIFFCYQMMRVSERMILPWWWVTDHVEATRVILGVEDPLSAGTKILSKISGWLAPLQGKADKDDSGPSS